MTEAENRTFEEWFEEKKEKCEVYGNGDDFWVDDEIKKFCLMGYELGLKVGRPQWHDLRKDPTDLPPKMVSNHNFSIEVLSDKGELVRYNFHYCKWFYWRSGEPIAWCELPTFDKEIEK